MINGTWHGHEVFGKTLRGHGHGHEKYVKHGMDMATKKSVKRGVDMDMVTLNLRIVAWTFT